MNKGKHLISRVKFANIYGITEVSVWASIYWIRDFEREDLLDKQIPIAGEPLPFTNLILLDEASGKVITRPGERGGVVITSVDRAKENSRFCYLTEDILHFINTGMVYPENIEYRHSGDVAIYNENMELTFVGRKDFQLKINGKRISPEEFEDVCFRSSLISNVKLDFKR